MQSQSSPSHTASSSDLVISTRSKGNRNRSKSSGTPRMATSPSSHGGGGGGGLVSHVALAVIDTRVILGALFGWTLVCRLVKSRSENTAHQRVISRRSSSSGHFISSSGVALEDEVNALRASVGRLREDNDGLAAQVAHLRTGLTRARTVQRSVVPKTLSGAFAAVAVATHEDITTTTITTPTGGATSTRPAKRKIVQNELFEAAAAVQTPAAAATAVKNPFYVNPATHDQSALPVQPEHTDGATSDTHEGDSHMLHLLAENQSLRAEVERLHVENAELADRMLELAFTEADISNDDGSGSLSLALALESREAGGGRHAASPLGELRRVLISESMAEEQDQRDYDEMLQELVKKNSSSGDDVDDVVIVDNRSGCVNENPLFEGYVGPQTPEMRVTEHNSVNTDTDTDSTNPRHQQQQRYIPAAEYLEE